MQLIYCFGGKSVFGSSIYFRFFLLAFAGKIKGTFWEEIVMSQGREAKIAGMLLKTAQTIILSVFLF